MSRRSSRRQFFRRHRGRINIILFLLLINAFTGFRSGEFWPWFLIPAFFIALPMIQDFVSLLIGLDDETEDEEEVDKRAGYGQPPIVVEEQPPAARPVSPQKQPVNSTVQAHLDKAKAYQEQIEAFIQATADPHSRDRLQDLSAQINEWTQAIEEMAKRIDNFQQNKVIRQDLESVPQSIEKLEAQLAHETDETIRAELKRTLAIRQNQLATLRRLQNMMRQAEIKIESTLASLGTIYSQLLTGQSTDHVADYSRLASDVNEEVRTLQDHLEALEEVKLGRE